MAKYNRFQRGYGSNPVFVCNVCKRRTRDSGQDVNHLCRECFELAGLDNTVNDNGLPIDDFVAERDALFKTAVNRGGDGDAIKRSFTYLWPVDEPDGDDYADRAAWKGVS